ncbi:MAG: MupG family TIM beta-alpha barrel fold protein [Coprobacillaceae bacterium]
MVGKEIGISIYPDFYRQEDCKRKLDYAKELGYTRVFTSIQLGDLGFENAGIGITDGFKFLFNYAVEIGMICHVDTNDIMLKYIGASPSNLKPLKDLNIPILRLDGGFNDDEVVEMTNNPYGIIIEENASNYTILKKRLKKVKDFGNIKQYYACHNFFPRNDTGLSLEFALNAAKMYKDEGCKVGVFIGSLYSQNDLNAVGQSVPTIEEHRYKPADIQAMELFATGMFDYIIFGDSNPREDELVAVSKVIVPTIDRLNPQQIEEMNADELEMLSKLYCIDLPVYFENIDKKTIDLLEEIVHINRFDLAQKVIRSTITRGMILMDTYQTIYRSKYAITIDNINSNRYGGELQIMLADLPSAKYANVIGYVKPYAYDLCEMIKEYPVVFRLRAK